RRPVGRRAAADGGLAPPGGSAFAALARERQPRPAPYLRARDGRLRFRSAVAVGANRARGVPRLLRLADRRRAGVCQLSVRRDAGRRGLHRVVCECKEAELVELVLLPLALVPHLLRFRAVEVAKRRSAMAARDRAGSVLPKPALAELAGVVRAVVFAARR